MTKLIHKEVDKKQGRLIGNELCKEQIKLISKVKVKNLMGLHMRPATAITKLLQECKSDVYFTYKQETINAKSLLSILMLAAPKNSKILITVEGEDADHTLERLIQAFENNFGE